MTNEVPEQLKMNGGELYFKSIREISPKVNEFIQDQIIRLGIHSAGLETILLDLPRKRAGKPIMRANMTYLAYRNLGGQNVVEELLPAMSISELSNYHLYLDNWIFDNKQGAHENRRRLSMITAASEVLRDLTQKVIENLNCSSEIRREISRRYAKSVISCCEGQVLDFSTSINDMASFDDNVFEDYFIMRARLQSGAMYGFSTETGALFVSTDETQIKNAKRFGELVGTGLHISNDLGDFALDVKDQTLKYYQDQLSDIKCGRVTYPIYYVLKHGSEQEKDALKNLVGNSSATYEEKNRATQSVFSSGAYSRTIRLLRDIAKQGRKSLEALPDNQWRNALSSMASTVRCNKYLTSVREVGGIK
ncbi:MAG: class 1 isoprenoid biosynthesis enzyme [Nanoarchaeota archaeon]